MTDHEQADTTAQALGRLGWTVTWSQCLNPGGGWTLWLASARQKSGLPCTGLGTTLKTALIELSKACGKMHLAKVR